MTMTLTIKKKLILIGVLAITALSCSSYMSYMSGNKLSTLNAISSVTQANNLIAQRMLTHRQELAEAFYVEMLHRGKGSISQEDIEAVAGAAEKLNKMTSRLIGREVSYLKTEDQNNARDLANEISKIAQEDLPKMITNGASNEEFDKLITLFRQKMSALNDAQISIRDAIQEETNSVGDMVIKEIETSNRNILIILGVALTIFLPLLCVIILSITRPLRNLSAEIERLSDGDYSRDLAGAERNDEIGAMVKSLNANVRKIRETVIKIKDAALSVNAAASEIAAGSSDLSMRTEQQASSLEETAASMEQITGTVKQNSVNASSANDLAATANVNADQGGRVVEQAVSAMSSIEKSSQKISDIIGVIDEIAFQTNLLALNAAVEAARAGDAGKGFAVVASEVRSLAGRSATASKEIKALINESAGQVKTGAQLVNQAGGTLKGIVDSVKQVAGIVSEIASASIQQATGIDEVNSAVTQMDEVTQQNAALVEENTAAAQSMLEQARALENLIAFFKVDENGSHAEHEPAKQAAKPAIVKSASAKKPAAKPSGAVARISSGHTVKAASGGAPAHDGGWEEF